MVLEMLRRDVAKKRWRWSVEWPTSLFSIEDYALWPRSQMFRHH